MRKINPTAVFTLSVLIIAYAIISSACVRHAHKRSQFCKEFCNGAVSNCSSTIKCADGRTTKFKGVINL